MSGLQTTPMYSYSKNTNVITFKLPHKQRKPLITLLFSLIAAVIVGAFGYFLPVDVRQNIAERILTPFCNTYLHVLDLFGIPLIFFTILLGICGIGDASSFGKIGKKMMGIFCVSLLAFTFIGTVAALPFFNLSIGSGGTEVDANSLLDMVLGFLPTNLITPFIECNAMQLIILAVVMGIAILKLSPVTNSFFKVAEGINSILCLMSEWFTRIIHIFVFLIILNNMWTGGVEKLLLAWKPWVIITVLQLLSLILPITLICIKNKAKFSVIIKKLMPTFLISFGTNSCGATIPEIFNCSAKLGVSSKVMSLGIPIGTSIYKPSVAIRFAVLSFFMAVTYNMNVSVSWIILVGVMAYILSVASPTMPGGALLFYPILFAQLGIPAEATAFMLAVDVFFDNICTACSMVNTELVMVRQADRLKLLDVEQLRKAE